MGPKGIKNIFLVSVIFLASCIGIEQKSEPVPMPRVPGEVTLTGTLTYQRFWGPPNYGEDTLTDKKEIYPILKTDTADIQLVTDKNLRSFENKKVSATGVLFEAQTGHHHTKILLELGEIK